MKIWIHTESGTWGTVDTLSVVNLPESPLHDQDAIIADLDAMSDEQINELGRVHGVTLSFLLAKAEENR